MLLLYFKSVQKIKEANFEILSGVIGAQKAKLIVDHFDTD
jgi:ERCC4-type nuclease